jgi:hypothetical protein
MTNDQIIDLYDSNPDMSLETLSKITNKTVKELKHILMS